jgi:type IV pilus assembly protein PilA
MASMGKGKRSAQTGMTIIEVMVVVAVIGIIASIAMPNVRTYTARAKVSEALLAISVCRNVIHEIFTSASQMPADNTWGCEAEKPSRFVERIRVVEEGVVKLTLGNEIGDLRLAIHDITLVALNGAGNKMGENDLGTPVRRWRCGATGDGTDVKFDLLPSSCRGS